MKTMLTVDVEYDPELTDPEGLAAAMDRLLETVLSTPGIMDEYGSPKLGEFFVASKSDYPAATSAMVIAAISGGVLQAVYCSDAKIKTVLVDFDTEGSKPAEDKDLFEIAGDNGRSRCVYVTTYPTAPLEELSGTEVAKALDKAGIDCQTGATKNAWVEKRWVLYDLTTDGLVTTRAYRSFNEANEDTLQVDDVLVLPIVLRGRYV